MSEDNLLEKIIAANNLVDKTVIVLHRWWGEQGPVNDWQETFAGFINTDTWQEEYAKNLAKPNIRQQVEDQIKMQKSWKEKRYER
jgi:hypothetical protein